ncbi:MAG: ABC transporter ATP-binding protein [Anaerolineales bacterium]
MRVELRKIHKLFDDVHANDDVNVVFEPGIIYGLLGENGAGKSTLMKILSGYQRPDSGKILLEDKSVRFNSPADALGAGIGMLYQEPLDLPPFQVYENYLLGRTGNIGINKTVAIREIRDLGKQYGFQIDPEDRVSDLSLGERQQLELLRLLAGGADLLIMDEPTTGISAEQKTLLFDSMRKLAREEDKTLILVSHKLEEVQELCDHVLVLRKGKLMGEAKLPVSKRELVGLMFESIPSPQERARGAQNETALKISGLVVSTPRLELQPVSLEVACGEVFGLAGLQGSGQELLLKACAGLVHSKAGGIKMDGFNVNQLGYHAARQLGIAYMAAGRLEEGLVAGLTLTEHVALVDENPRFFVDWWANRERAGERIDRYQVIGRPETTVEQLSGGNQQRFLFGLLPSALKVILMEHPTRGLDIRSTEWIWQQLEERRSEGTAILFVSADLDEIIERSDRIAVFSGGRMSRVVEASKTSVDELGHLIGGEQ